MVHYKLSYFDIRGLGETARLIFHYAGVEFEDHRIKGEEWADLKPKTPTGKVPILEVDGKQLVESAAINRYLANKYGLRPKDDWENAQMESAVEYYRDFTKEIRPYFQAAESEEKEKLFKELFLPNAERVFKRLNDILSKTKDGFLVDSGLSWGDLFLANTILSGEKSVPDFEKLFPAIVEYEKRVHNHPKIKDYVAKRPESKN